MNRMLIIVPTRGRPDNVFRQVHAAGLHRTRRDTRFMYCVDDDDPRLVDYRRVMQELNSSYPGMCIMREEERGTITQIMNRVVSDRAHAWQEFIGFMGDDHMPRTVGWDQRFVDVLSDCKVAMIYGNDLMQGRNLPTHIVMTSNIIRALGYMVPPTFTHLYIDNVWKELGLATQTLHYLDDVIIEHMHPGAGKTEWDDGYKRVNAGEMYARDEAAYREYMLCRHLGDVTKIVELQRTVSL